MFETYDKRFEAWLKELQELLPAEYQTLSLFELSERLEKFDLDTAWLEFTASEFAEMIAVEL